MKLMKVMNKIVFLVMFLGLFCSPAIAMDINECDSSEGNSMQSEQNNQNHQPTENQDSDIEGVDDFYDELIYPEYGSDDSPDFLNRENTEPYEPNNGYSPD